MIVGFYCGFKQLYPVSSSFGAPILFSIERAAAPYFGIKVCAFAFCLLILDFVLLGRRILLLENID